MNQPLTQAEQQELQQMMIAVAFSEPAKFANQALIIKTGPMQRIVFVENGPAGPVLVASVLLPDLAQLRDAIDQATKPKIVKAPAGINLGNIDLSKIGNG